MNRSGLTLQSPKSPKSPSQQGKSSLSYAGPELDSPSRQKLKMLSDKWQNVHQVIDQDKVEKRVVLDERVAIIENVLAQQKPKDEQKFKVLKDQVLRLQNNSINERTERENFDAKKNGDLATMQDNIIGVLQKERAIKQQSEVKLAKQSDERFSSLSMTLQRNNQAYEQRVGAKLQETNQQVQLIKNQIEAERRQREESSQNLATQIEVDINKFQDQLLIEKKVREETQSKIFRMIEDIHTRLQQEIAGEKKERELTTEHLLKVLEDACIKIEKFHK